MLQQTPIVNDRQGFQIEVPLDPATDNTEHVAQVLDHLFGVLDDIRVRFEVSEPDMVQALTIATAVRATMAEMEAGAEPDRMPRLLDIAVQNRPSQAGMTHGAAGAGPYRPRSHASQRRKT